MKILYFSSHPNLNFGAPSGPGTHMREMVRAFGELGHEVQLLIMGGEEWNEDQPISSAPGLKHRLKPLIPGLIWHTMKDRKLRSFDAHAREELEKKCIEFQPDLIYERGYYLMCSGTEVARSRSIPHVLEINAPYPEEKVDMEGKSLLHHRALKAERFQAEKTDRLVVVSSDLKEYYRRRLPSCEDKIVVTPNAIRDPDDLPLADASSRIRSRYGIADSATVVGFVGSIFPYHGVDALISAFASLEGQYHLLVVGGGAILDDLKQQASAEGIGERITFTDNIPHQEVADHISAMDVTVMARSNWYGSPVKIFEYGMQGKPVIAPDVGPVRDVMKHMETGILVGEAEAALELALRALLEDKDLRKRIGQAFREKVAREHTWKQMATTVLLGFQPRESSAST